MSYSVEISNLENNTFWKKQLTEEEFSSIRSHVRNFKTKAIFPATLKPVRTNNFQNFAKDFFLPTLVNHAIKVEHAVKKIFAILGALILDTLTFPIRLLTCIPRAISNARQEQNPLKKYLLGKGVDPKLLASDHVKVRLEWEETSQFRSKHSQEKRWIEQNVYFIEVPVNYLDYGQFSSYSSC